MKQRNKKKNQVFKSKKKKEPKAKKNKAKKIKQNKKKQTKESNKLNKILSEAQIKKLLDFSHIEELYMILKILNEKETLEFINHYKKSKETKNKDKRIDKIIRKSHNSKELLKQLMDLIVELLTKEYQEMYQNISSLRKQGKDLFIEELKIINLPQKIRLFEVTGEKKDYYKIKKVIEEVKKEITHVGANVKD